MKPSKPINQPHKHVEATHGAKTQYAEKPDDGPKLKKDDIIDLMQIVVSLLFYARSNYFTMFFTLSDITSEQSIGTEATQKAE